MRPIFSSPTGCCAIAWNDRLKNTIRRLYNRLLLEYDAAKWRRDLTSWRAVSPVASQGVLLISDLSSMVATAKVQALIAGCLEREHGLRAVVVLPRREPVLERIYRAACAKVEFRYFDRYLAATDRMAAEIEAQRLSADARSSAALVAIERNGVRIGRNALSLLLRRRRTGRLDLNDLTIRAEAIQVIADALQAADAATALVQELKPVRALFNERGYTPAGELFDACLLADCHAVQWFAAPRSDSLMYTRYRLDNRGDHPMALARATWQQVCAEPWSAQQDQAVMDRIAANYQDGGWYNRQKLQDGKRSLTPAQTRAALELPEGRRVAVIFAHILYDATFFYGDSLYPDYEEWLVETVRHAISNPELTWIVKVHPVNVWRSRMDGAAMEQLEARALENAFGVLPPHVRIMPADTPINTASLYAITDYGLTVRGTVGMELPCMGIPVVTAGTGRYSGLGFTIDPSTQEAYAETLSSLHTRPALDDEAIRLARRHYDAAINLRPQLMQSFFLDFNANTFGLPALQQNTMVSYESLCGAWQPGNDLSDLARWIASDSPFDLFRGVSDMEITR